MMSYEFVILEENGTACEFALDDIYWEGGTVTGVDATGVPPRAAALLTNLPTPFRGGTELRFELPATDAYEIAVFDAAGKRVRSPAWRLPASLPGPSRC